MLNRRLVLIGAAASAAGAALAQFPRVAIERTEVREDGFVGSFHFAHAARNRTTVIMLNGSDGGLPSVKDANDLALSGYPTLALAYFKDWRGEPTGLPASLNEIPLEYFFRAIDWLKRQPQVDPARIVLMGQSRGGELVLLLASLRPDVAGVVAFSPSSRVWGGIPPYGSPPGPTRPAWTLAGKPVAFQDTAFDPSAPMRQWFVRAKPVEAARIPVERIHGSVLLVSSRADTVWPATTYADEAAARLAKQPDGRRVENLQFTDAGHLLMGTGPGITKFEIPGSNFTFDFGGTAQGTATHEPRRGRPPSAFLPRFSYNQPLRRAVRPASTRLAAPSLPAASAR